MEEPGPGVSRRPLVRQGLGKVISVEAYTPDAYACQVEMDGPGAAGSALAWAIAYTGLVGTPCPGDRVLLNVTAVELALGTGGVHFVICILPSGGDDNPGTSREEIPLPGHIMKLRYLPHQCAVAAAEDVHRPYRSIAEGEEDLDGAPVVCCELHSQVAAVAAGFLARMPAARVIYVMTPGAALPLSFSRLSPALKAVGLLHGVITAGQCIGGDLEAINVYSAMLLAKHALHADLVIVGQGPGNAGTGTRFGFSGIEQGDNANAAASLGGRPIVCLRASSVDPRERHRSPSHHTLTVLDRVVRCRCVVPIARDVPGSRRRQILDAMSVLRLLERHDVKDECRGGPGVDLLVECGVGVTTMGRTIEQDREFFLHASASGCAAANMVEMARAGA